ncbi:MAG: filamentous hemagglutinin N-terminal domain-containing protein [Thiobacillus sp.]|nr:filamentous hemagglutinin N-terminal domain-containing protein [Thiobacillus sp.]
MNHVDRLIWNQGRKMWIAVAEDAGEACKGVSPRSHRDPIRLVLSPFAVAVMAALASYSAPVLALPTGAQVVAGQARVDQSGQALTVTQSTDKAILNWRSFGIGAGEIVSFQQPGTGSVALNRVLGSEASAIYGRLDANGQVFLVNPSGVYFAPGAQVNVGGLVASTLDLTDADFLGGNYRFQGQATVKVVNDGTITAAPGGYVAFIGRRVENNGSISTPGGTTALGAGSRVDLTLAGNSLLSFNVNAGQLNALARNGGVIQADGGRVILTAQAKDALLNTVVNNTGIIRAQTVAERDGIIELLGGDEGVTRVSGTLDASAPHGGDGGFIETSGAHLRVKNGTVITTRAAGGRDGTWLIDPDGFTIAASGGDLSGATLSASLGNGNVTIESVNGSGTGGDILVNDTVSWSANTLTLDATNDILINAEMFGSGTASLALEYGQGAVAAGNMATYHVNAPVNLPAGNNFSTRLGSDGVTLGYTVITGLGAEGSTTATDLQGINGGLGGRYVLGADIDATATSGWNAGEGFAPIGSSATKFTGTLDGLGHVITGLSIARASTDNVGLFGYVNGGNIRNLGLAGGSVDGNDNVGALAGYINNGSVSNVHASVNVSGNLVVGGMVGEHGGGSISDAFATGSVIGKNEVGGLVGINSGGGAIRDAYATGDVTGTGLDVGGLVGYLADASTISHAYATGTVSGNGKFVGGLVGYSNAGSAISDAYATGAVVGGNDYVGGLVGYNADSSISDAYATGSVTGNDYYVGGLVGTNDGGQISTSYATGLVDGANTLVGGLVGQNRNSVNNDGTITNSYWDKNTTGKFIGVGIGTSTGATGLFSDEMKQQAKFGGFDFTNDWFVYEGRTTPLLRSYLTPVNLMPKFNGNTQTLNRIGDYVTNLAGADTSHIFRSSSNLTLSSTTTAGREVAQLVGEFWSDQRGYLITVKSRTITGTGSAANNLTIKNPLTWTSGTLTLNAKGAIQLNGNVQGAIITATAKGGAITQATGKTLKLTGASTFKADNGLSGASNVRYNVTLNRAGNNFSTVSATGKSINVRDDTGALNLKTVDAKGTLVVKATKGAIGSVTGASVKATGATTLTADNGVGGAGNVRYNITLNRTGNKLATVTAKGKSVNLRDDNALTAKLDAKGTGTLRAGGALVVSGTVTGNLTTTTTGTNSPTTFGATTVGSNLTITSTGAVKKQSASTVVSVGGTTTINGSLGSL